MEEVEEMEEVELSSDEEDPDEDLMTVYMTGGGDGRG
jgi:hypothetical protein